MGRRVQLQTLLEGLLGSTNVYFQPPESVKLKYPCIIYHRNLAETKCANDQTYNYRTGYAVIVVDPNPDSEIPERIASLPMSTFNRHYTVDNLNHDFYNLYY